jgi:D-sedoheptulose 7-phosphate isomerase
MPDDRPPPNLIMGDRYYIGKGAFVEAPNTKPSLFFDSLANSLKRTQVTGPIGDEKILLDKGLKSFETMLKASHKAGGKAIFIGNGGSAAIASHMAVDYSKNKGVRAVALNDASMLTMIANDYGYDRVFSKQLEWQAREEDVVVIISSSGRSLNIIDAAGAALERGCRGLVTFSGMNPNNQLRRKGNLNFYVPCLDYGVVELAHLALLHSVAST